jgi:hypothetical protein
MQLLDGDISSILDSLFRYLVWLMKNVRPKKSKMTLKKTSKIPTGSPRTLQRQENRDMGRR